MDEISELKIPYEELKSLVIDAIKLHGDSFQYVNIFNTIGSLAIKKGLALDPHPKGHSGGIYWLNHSDQNKVREVLWDLITERVVTIGDHSNDSWPYLSLTEYGKKAINSKDPIPNDITGYLARIKSEIPDLDHIIEIYLLESIKTYNINQLLSATMTLGCASEKALLLLIEAFCDSYIDPGKKVKFQNKIKGKFIKNQFEEFDKEVQLIKGNLPYELKDGYTNTLTGVFQMIRNNRNYAGHPTGKKIDKNTLFANLQVFITYCKFIYDLKKHFEDNRH